MKQSKENLRLRRSEIRRMLRCKKRPAEIMSQLMISRSTLWRDLKALRIEDQKWLNEMAEGEFISSYRLAIESLGEIQRDLRKIVDNAALDRDKISGIRLMAEIEVNIIDLLAYGPTVLAMKRNLPFAFRN